MPGIVEESQCKIILEDMLSISSKMILNPIEKVETLRIPNWRICN